MRFMVVVGAVMLTAVVAVAQPPVREPIREGKVERLVLDDGTDADAATWVPSEAAVAVDKKHAKRGDTALRMHIDVNWETGEKAYPVGWPRMYRDWPEAVQNWSSWDYLDFSIFVESSRASLPVNPMGLILKGANKQSILTRPLSELRLGEWTDYRLPLADILGSGTMTGLQVYISESDYKHGDVLDFWIDNISLARYSEPSAASTTLPEHAIAGDAAYLPVDLHLMGVPPDKKADVLWQIKSDGKSAAAGKLSAARGKTRLYLSLPPQGLQAGEYELLIKTGSEALAFPFRAVPSPWQEVSR